MKDEEQETERAKGLRWVGREWNGGRGERR